MKKTPMQLVKESFGDRASLVAELAKVVDRRHGDTSTDDVKSRLMGLSNAKLLRLYRVEQTVRERYGGRDKLVEAIVDARRKAGLTADDDFKAKLETYTKAQLVDLTNMRIGDQKVRSPGAKPVPKRAKKPAEAPAAAEKKATAKKAEAKTATKKKAATKAKSASKKKA